MQDKEKLLVELETLRSEVSELRRLGSQDDAERKNSFSQSGGSFLRILFDATPAFFVVIDADGKTLMINRTMLDTLGYAEEEVIGRGYIKTFIPQDEWEDLIKLVNSIISNREPYISKNSILTKNGERRHVEWHARPLFKENGELDFILGTGVDMTYRQKAESALRESEANYRAIFDSANDAIVVHEIDDGRVIEVNRKMSELFGYTCEDAPLSGIDLVSAGTSPYSQKEAMEWIQKAAEEGPQLFEWLARDKSGRQFWVEMNLRRAKIRGKDRVLSIVRDISERKDLAKELAKRNRELESILYTMSHDLKAPVVTIQGFSDLIIEKYEDEVPEKCKNYLQRIHNASDTLKQLIDDILKVARAERETIDPITVSFSAVVDSVRDSMDETIREKGITLKIANDLPKVFADPFRLRQVMENLVSNAVRFGDPEKTPKIEIGWSDDGGQIVFFIKDNGIGIDPAHQERIFEPFYRIRESRNEGNGIGLALVKLLIEQHGGRIWLESTRGEGSTFYFSLPEKPAAKEN